MVSVNGRMQTDWPARCTFVNGQQLCPIDYVFTHAWSFGLIKHFEVAKIGGSDHYPLRAELHVTRGNNRETALQVHVEYPKRLTTRISEEHVEKLRGIQQAIPLEEISSKKGSAWFETTISTLVDSLRVKFKGSKPGLGSKRPYKNECPWFDEECRITKALIRQSERRLRARYNVEASSTLLKLRIKYKSLIRYKKELIKIVAGQICWR